jgi:hypothetical protein
MDGEEKGKPGYVSITGSPSTWHQSRRSGRSSALPYPPDWYLQNKDTDKKSKEKTNTNNVVLNG